jgi:ribosomal protein S18 acetylase RimI-like enzyme
MDSLVESARERKFRYIECSISENNNASQHFFDKYAAVKQFKIVKKYNEYIADSSEVLIKLEL